VITAHALLRTAGGTSGILIGLYLASLSNHGLHEGVALIGLLGAVGFAAELFASIPMGIASDAMQPRQLMASGALLGAFAAFLFPLTHSTPVFFVSRALEGLGAAAIVPALLANLADMTQGKPAIRVRAMSYFELTLLAGIALGGLVASQLFRVLGTAAFMAVAIAYLVCAALLFRNVSAKKVRHIANPLADLRDVLRLPSVRRLAPVWLSVNAVVGLWLGPVLPFLLTRHATGTQYLAGIYAGAPSHVGWLLLGYAIVFGTGVVAWSVILPRVPLQRAMGICLAAMLPVCAGIYLLNHSAGQSAGVRWIIGGITALLIMVESGFTPAALAWLAASLPVQSGRGAAMGIYSVLLSVGAIVGSLLAAVLGGRYSIDGLLYGTVGVALVALLFLRFVARPKLGDTGVPA